ncbi:MAG: transcriptional regulator [Candidatus Micrarchaeia archaeon]
MEPKCDKITKIILPAIRAALASELSRRGYTQQQIAGMIGVAQVAVSKYLNGKYSKKIENTKNFIIKNNMIEEIIGKEETAHGEKGKDIKKFIEELCNDGRLMAFVSS